jgi:hypothetical protein
MLGFLSAAWADVQAHKSAAEPASSDKPLVNVRFLISLLSVLRLCVVRGAVVSTHDEQIGLFDGAVQSSGFSSRVVAGK